MARVVFSDMDRVMARAFAAGVAEHTFNRRAVSVEEQSRDIRVGKLGEIAFAHFLEENGRAIKGAVDMFTVWASPLLVDTMDFETQDGKSVDVKTASRDHHIRILVPVDQFLNQPKDYYVGVRIAIDELTATIVGYTTWQAINEAGRFGGAIHYPAYGKLFQELEPIGALLALMPPQAGARPLA